MATDADLLLLVLHGLRLGGVVSADAVALRWDLEPGRVDVALADARERGWVVRREGPLTGWALSAAGRREGERRLAAELDRSGARTIVEEAYATFGPLNRRFLDLCTEWQLRTVDGRRVVNDHTDATHDRRVRDRLEAMEPEVIDLVGTLADRLARFGGYRARFVHAGERIRAGSTEWFTQPLLDSYHTVWFELHEDLLATLGRTRNAEAGER